MSDDPVSPPRHLLARIVVTLLLVAGLLLAGRFAQERLAAMRQAPAQTRMEMLPPLVRVARATQQDRTLWMRAHGVVEAPLRRQVVAEVGGRVLTRAALEVGDALEAAPDAPRTVATLDTQDASDRLAQAEDEIEVLHAEQARVARIRAGIARRLQAAREELETAEREYERIEALVPHTLTRSDLDRQRLQVQARQRAIVGLGAEDEQHVGTEGQLVKRLAAARHSISLMTRAVARGSVTTSHGGLILTRHVEVGDVVQPGAVLFTLLDTSRVEVPLVLPAQADTVVRVGSAVHLLDAKTGDMLMKDARIARRHPTIDPATRTLRAIVVLEGTPTKPALTPGRHVLAKVQGASMGRAVQVAREAFLEGTLYVAVPTPDAETAYRVEARTVTARHGLDGTSWVADGLEDGELVILTNLESLEADMTVRVVVEGEPTDAPAR